MKKALVAIVVVAVLLTFCATSQKSKNHPTPTANFHEWPTEAPGAVSTLAGPTLSPEDVHKYVLAAWKILENAPPRHFEQFTYVDGKKVIAVVADAVPPNYHQAILNQGKVVTEFYIVDGMAYNYNNGEWSRVAASSTVMYDIGSNLLQALDPDIFQSDGKRIGVEDIDGSPAILYFYSTIYSNPALLHQHRLWVDQRSRLPVKLEMRDSRGDFFIETITYDNSLTITVPEAAKEAPFR